MALKWKEEKEIERKLIFFSINKGWTAQWEDICHIKVSEIYKCIFLEEQPVVSWRNLLSTTSRILSSALSAKVFM